MAKGQFSAAMQKTRELAKLSLDGLNYYHRYDRLHPSFLISFAVLGLALNVIVEVVQETNNEIDDSSVGTRNLKKDTFLKYGVGAALIVVIVLQITTSVPFMHSLYCFVSSLLWYRLLRNSSQVVRICSVAYSRTSIGTAFFKLLAAFIVVELVVLTFFHRQSLSVLLVVCAVLSMVLLKLQTQKVLQLYCVLGAIVFLLLAAFPLLPVIDRDKNLAFVVIAGLVSAIIGLTFTFLFPPRTFAEAVVLVLTGAVILCTAIRYHTEMSYDEFRDLPFINQILSWFLLCTLPIIPLWSKPFLTERLLTLFLAFSSLCILTSISYEGLFFVCLSIGLTLWIWIEKHFIVKKHADSLVGLAQSHHMESAHFVPVLDVFDYFRLANEFLFFIALAFFGTNSIGTLKFPNPLSARCFLTAYSPLMTSFITLVKIGIPFFIVASFFNAMRIALNFSVGRLLLAAMVSADIMALQFFFLIRDQGSWRDIGTSLAKFIVAVVLMFVLYPLVGLTACFLRRVDQDRSKTHQW